MPLGWELDRKEEKEGHRVGVGFLNPEGLSPNAGNMLNWMQRCCQGGGENLNQRTSPQKDLVLVIEDALKSSNFGCGTAIITSAEISS